jgi:hypothetical protein
LLRDNCGEQRARMASFARSPPLLQRQVRLIPALFAIDRLEIDAYQ